MELTEKVSIFEYYDYREYLQDIFTGNGLTLRKIAFAVGTSHGYFSQILNGKRSLSKKKVPVISKLLSLNLTQERYLTDLIIMNDSSSPEKRNLAFQAIKSLSVKNNKSSLELQTYKYLEKWQYVVIRELVNSHEFVDEPSWIQKQLLFPLRTREVSEALKFLKKNNFIKKVNNRWVQTSKNLKCSGGVFNLSLTNFHINMLKFATLALSKLRRPERIQRGYTFCLSEKDFKSIQSIVDRAIEDIKKIEEKSVEKDRVYHVNFAAFPFTGKKGLK